VEKNCNNFAGMPEASCVGGRPVVGWAIGGEGFTFPDHVGMEMSGPVVVDTLQYVLLEMHYDNPQAISGRADTSGFRVYYSPTLREESAGMLEVGLTVGPMQFIPAKINTVNYGYCLPECTQAGLSQDVYIFASLLHAHTIGVALRARHVDSNGVEMQPIDVNWSYDFNYQQMVALDPEVALSPGDGVMLECYYDASGRSTLTYGGTATTNEMCLVYFLVYPKPTLSECMTAFDQSDVFGTWGNTAFANRYLTGTNLNNFYYNISVPGAEAHYDALWTGVTGRLVQCSSFQGGSVVAGSKYNIFDIVTPWEDPQICVNGGNDLADGEPDAGWCDGETSSGSTTSSTTTTSSSTSTSTDSSSSSSSSTETETDDGFNDSSAVCWGTHMGHVALLCTAFIVLSCAL